MRRKKVALLGCLVLLMACDGCGADKPIETEVLVTRDEVQEASQNTEVDEETGSTELAVEAEETEDSVMPQIEIENHRKRWKSEDGETVLFTYEYDTVKVENKGMEALEAAIAADFPADKDLADDSEELEWAKSDYEYAMSADGSGYFYGYETTERITVERCDENIVSVSGNYSGYTGGAHGYYGTTGYTYDVKKGVKLELSDLLEKEQDFQTKAIEYICNRLNEDYADGLFPEYRETVEVSVTGENQNYWYLNGTGIVFVYNPYEVGPYAMGQASVTLPYGEFGQYMKAEYINGAFVGASSISANTDLSGIVGVNQPVMLKQTCIDKEYYEYEYAIQSGDQEFPLGEYNDYFRSFILRRSDGRSFLFVSFDYASADYVSFVFELTEGQIRQCDEIGNICFSGTALSETELVGTFQMDMLGTYGAKMHYAILEDGKLQEMSQICEIDSYFELTVTKELPVTIDGKEELLPVGTKISITGTDRENAAFFKTPDGVEGKIEVTRDEENYGFLIDGISENEYFEMVPYVG